MPEINRSENVMKSDINNKKGAATFVMAKAQGQSTSAAAVAAGISPKTGHRRMKTQEWNDAIQQMHALVVEQALEFAALHLADTLTTVKDIRDTGDSDSVRLGAARTILQIALQKTMRLELSVEDESPVEQEKQLNFRALNEEELMLFLALMAKLEGKNEHES